MALAQLSGEEESVTTELRFSSPQIFPFVGGKLNLEWHPARTVAAAAAAKGVNHLPDDALHDQDHHRVNTVQNRRYGSKLSDSPPNRRVSLGKPAELVERVKFVLQTCFSTVTVCCLCIGSDTISTGQSLFPNQTIVSKQGKFELGFFAPGNSSNHYVGIWYKNISVRTVVWVGNRNYFIRSSNYNNLRLEMSNGNLYLYVDLERIGISSVEASNATEAVILDTGNLVLRNASAIIWQSFDHPTDTWLPGGQLGFRRFSDTESELVSWRNPDDPATGVYSFGMDPNGGSELFITANDTRRLWRSGVWQGGTFTSLSDGVNFYNFTYVSTGDTVYLTYNVYDETLLTRIQIDYFGRLIHYVWLEGSQAWNIYRVQPSDACKSYAMCGPNAICNINSSPICGCLNGFVPRFMQEWDSLDFSGGCVRRRPLECSEERTEYITVNNIRLPVNSESLEIRRDGVCEIVRLVNCSCNGYSYDSSGGCLLFMGELVDLERLSNGSAGGNLYVRMESLDSAVTRPGNEPTKKEIFDWSRRVHIIEGIAQGLLYLHHYSRLRIVHRDLKASNILLDGEMNPKISDFGMARIFGGNDSQANTKRIVGTYGFMSPEYAMEGLFSVKSDVFAFGVLMLEIISGKKNTGFYGSDYISLLGYAWHMWKHDRVLELIDPILEMPSSSSSTPMRYVQIGLLCVQESPADRPLMSDVVAMLNNEQTAIASPQHPAFTVGRTLAKESPGQGKVGIFSINGLTVSQMEAR
ncbi:hypothetical protein DH2020_008918 [Rehmannia glutinosa]|uniref:Receptor-like serine/threonine-protein kinase n=1 Tax=Rehmannia glutinosa TaxID=99300 RepID=A0ABR0X5D6_REHGL